MENEENFYSFQELSFIDSVTKRLNSSALPKNDDSYLEIRLRDNVDGSKIGYWTTIDDTFWIFVRPVQPDAVQSQVELLRDLAKEAEDRGDIGKEDKDGIAVWDWLEGIAKRLERKGKK